MFNYSYLTRKQANIVYAAAKDGRISMDERDIRMMYDIVGCRELSVEGRQLASRVENAVKWLLESRDALAQAALDGMVVVAVCEKRTRPATEDDWFYEVGEDVEEEVFVGYEALTQDEYRFGDVPEGIAYRIP